MDLRIKGGIPALAENYNLFHSAEYFLKFSACSNISLNISSFGTAAVVGVPG
jgi:hypothetical protein